MESSSRGRQVVFLDPRTHDSHGHRSGVLEGVPSPIVDPDARIGILLRVRPDPAVLRAAVELADAGSRELVAFIFRPLTPRAFFLLGGFDPDHLQREAEVAQRRALRQIADDLAPGLRCHVTTVPRPALRYALSGARRDGCSVLVAERGDVSAPKRFAAGLLGCDGLIASIESGSPREKGEGSVSEQAIQDIYTTRREQC